MWGMHTKCGDQQATLGSWSPLLCFCGVRHASELGLQACAASFTQRAVSPAHSPPLNQSAAFPSVQKQNGMNPPFCSYHPLSPPHLYFPLHLCRDTEEERILPHVCGAAESTPPMTTPGLLVWGWFSVSTGTRRWGWRTLNIQQPQITFLLS